MLIVLCVLCFLSAAGWGLQASTSGGELLFWRGEVAVSHPPDAPEAQFLQFHASMETGSPLPADWTVSENLGCLSVHLSEREAWCGKRELVATILDEADDLAGAWLFIDGELVFHASRANGGIVDAGWTAKATLPTWVFPLDAAVKVEWTALDGTVRCEEASLRLGEVVLARLRTNARRWLAFLWPGLRP